MSIGSERKTWALFIFCLLSFVFDDVFDPADVVPDSGVDSREVRVCTSDPPRHDALEAAVANQRPAGVSLRRYNRALY